MYYYNGFLNKLERKFGRLAINNLMTIVVGAMVIVYIMDIAISLRFGVGLSSILMFDRAAIAAGQVWRIFTFLFIPSSTGIFALISMYFYWIVGKTLENEWGAFKFTVFYLFGALGAIASGMITGYATNSFLNMSLFLAFALLNPEFEILLFFFFPIKVKWIALVDLVLIAYNILISSWADRLAIIMAMANLIIFFAPQISSMIKGIFSRRKW